MFDTIFKPLDNFWDWLVLTFCDLAPTGTLWSYDWNVRGLFAILLIGLVCGAVGSLVIGNRMAFFSDALAHCAFAGVSLGLLVGLLTGTEEGIEQYITPIMVSFGIIMGFGISYVREKTGQAADTVIGVFFAGSLGLGAIFIKAFAEKRYFSPVEFLFGSMNTVQSRELSELTILALITLILFLFLYNQYVFSSFSPSLARSRGINLRFCQYSLILLLALIVNICLKTVGVLLINALLIVPAAAAANFSRNMRQLFYIAVALCVGVGVGGQWLSWEIWVQTNTHPGESGTIVVLAVLFYFVSIFVAHFRK